ncbi:MAG: UDP-3-O-(3-hydroxymyristoyl)glucosamine N-acyltransferase [Cyanobacteriota bacterium]|nr:UDP-3-O-(3-hydroxymyristoyl)glucosamine N-acyltransferase [Cyanobacteriota bacterium]
MKFSQLIQQLGDEATHTSLSLTRENDPDICGVADVDDATPGTLSFIENRKFADRAAKTAASALILPPDDDLQAQASERKIAWIATTEPRLLFAKTLALFYQPFHPAPEIHPKATIDPSAKIGRDVYIGANVVICDNVEIGDRVCIHPNVVIYPQVRIGEGTILHANCTIHERARLGKNCIVHSGAVIGAEGFGFVPTSSGWYKMQQSGFTILEDSVEIGCNSTIDRPAVGQTRIGRNTKIDNLVQIGHGCKIGSNCALAAQVGLAGRVALGNNILLAGQVGVANQARIGDGAIASAKTGIHQDVAPGTIVSGFPAIANKLWLKNAALYKRLPEIYQTIRELKRRLKSPD